MSTAVWIVIILALVIACAGGGKKASGSGKSDRIDHPHLLDDTDYECPKCGARFSRDIMKCPRCGATFSGKREDWEEFNDEEDEMEAWDEEEGL